jgi:hypothetical protein
VSATAVERRRSGHSRPVTDPEPDPAAPQPRDIALEQPSSELLQELEEESAYPDEQPDKSDEPGAERP